MPKSSSTLDPRFAPKIPESFVLDEVPLSSNPIPLSRSSSSSPKSILEPMAESTAAWLRVFTGVVVIAGCCSGGESNLKTSVPPFSLFSPPPPSSNSSGFCNAELPRLVLGRSNPPALSSSPIPPPLSVSPLEVIGLPSRLLLPLSGLVLVLLVLSWIIGFALFLGATSS